MRIQAKEKPEVLAELPSEDLARINQVNQLEAAFNPLKKEPWMSGLNVRICRCPATMS